jgi:hypothetical protein
MKPMRTLAFAIVIAIGCSGAAKPKKPCGLSPSDWCPSPAGDPCGQHKDLSSCKADKRCKGMPYAGESVIACSDDGSGFSPNCPTVGCISR